MIAVVESTEYIMGLMGNPYTEVINGICASYHLSTGEVIQDIRPRVSSRACRFLYPDTDIPGVWRIPLSKGGYAIIDESDVALVSGRNWAQNQDGYVQANFKKEDGSGFKSLKLHKILLPAVAIVDHHNGIVTDNRRENLRDSTFNQNNWNSSAHQNSKTQMKGAWRHESGRFRSEIVVNGERIYLGSFATPEMAAIAYEAASKVAHRQFSVYNR